MPIVEELLSARCCSTVWRAPTTPRWAPHPGPYLDGPEHIRLISAAWNGREDAVCELRCANSTQRRLTKPCRTPGETLRISQPFRSGSPRPTLSANPLSLPAAYEHSAVYSSETGHGHYRSIPCVSARLTCPKGTVRSHSCLASTCRQPAW